MASKKISQLTAGTPVQATDRIPVARGSDNRSIPASDLLRSAQNLGDLGDSAAARSNLGLGTAATQASTVFTQREFTLPSWITAKAAVAAGTDDATIVTVGDSTNTGAGALASGFASNNKSASYPTYLAGLLAHGSWQNFWGTQNIGLSQIALHDTRLVLGANIIIGTGAQTLGYKIFQENSPNTDAVEFTPTTPVDRFDIWYITDATAANMGWAIDGGAITTFNAVAATGIARLTVAAPTLGLHTLKVSRQQNGFMYLFGARGYNSAVKEVTVWNCGMSGATANDIALPAGSADVGPLAALKALAPDLTILCCTINDWAAATSAASYLTDMQSIITAAKLSGDVVIVTGVPSDTTVASVAQQQIYIDLCKQLARKNGLPLLNLTERWGSYVAANAIGLMRDTKHPLSVGYADMAAAISALL